MHILDRTNKVLNINLSGIDYMSKSIEIPYTINGYILEVNGKPNIHPHHKVDKNTKNFAINRFVETIFFTPFNI